MIEIALSIIISVCFVLAAYAGKNKRWPSDIAFEDFEALNQMKYSVPIVIIQIFVFSYFLPQRTNEGMDPFINDSILLILQLLFIYF